MKRRIRVVAAVIYNEHNQILCAKRSAEMSMPGKWEFPGGKVENGESDVDALTREIKEELQCEIEVERLITEVNHEYEAIIVQLVTYAAKIMKGIPLKSEHEKLEWLTLDQLSSVDWAEADLPTVALLAK
ncbi:(deoxy)nucleoside triphosphate pyrophosphohydrolase [Bacillus salitolerans]|uniref:8-oxo-dGTP diphosphatase n=1 Tax=Bacillus salitolerans TaxID=1437434 RepID=A0ABW4LXZ6_9BACI